MASTTAHPRRLGRSTAAVLGGFVAVVVLSLATDEVLHLLKVFPPWSQPMYDTRLLLLATSYRTAYNVVGGYITARLAPHAPMRHVWTLAVIGLVAGLAGAIATISAGNFGPNWYPISLVVTAVPFTWLGGVVRGIRHASH